MKKLFKTGSTLFLLFIVFSFYIKSKTRPPVYDLSSDRSIAPPFLPAGHWADSVLKTLTIEERIAQLFVVAAYSNKGADHIQHIEKLIKQYHIGGLIFFQGGPLRQARLTNRYQTLSKIPLLICMDAEWGLAMRLDSTCRFPRQMMLGAIGNDSLIYMMGAEIASQCKRMGVHVNLAPVVDINCNPENPVINSRSFGELKQAVARKGIAYMKGMQDNGVLACAKHFPGHGDTDRDSHLTLPVVKHDKTRLDTLELYPFKELIRAGVGGIMVAHLFVPSIDSTPNTAVTLSAKAVNGLLKKQLGFKGLAFTDALNMKGVSKFLQPGELELKALLAGNDVLLFSQDVPLAVQRIKEAIAKGLITQEEIDKRCRKILALKQWAGLNHYKPIELKGLISDLNNKHAAYIKRKLIASAMTLISDKRQILPFKRLDTLTIASVAMGANKQNAFQKMMNRYTKVDAFFISPDADGEEINSILQNLLQYNLVVISLHRANEKPWKHFGITKTEDRLISEISQQHNTLVCLFANPYALKYLPSLNNANACLIAYEDGAIPQQCAAELLFGGIPSMGHLPVTATEDFPAGIGITSKAAVRFQYTLPEDAGINASDLDSISIIVRDAIYQQAFPGCQVLIAKDMKVIYNRSFGYHTYEAKRKVTEEDLYDLASVTKIGASVPALMKLTDENKINIDSTLGTYLPSMVDTTAYKNLILRDILAHQAGLVSWIPFYLKTLTKGEPDPQIYSDKKSADFPYRVAENLYISKDYPKEIYRRILATPVKERGEYKYSDIGYYFFLKIIEKLTGQTLDAYVTKTFYKPLGMTTSCYKPRRFFDLSKIVPTEYDMQFRKQLIHGDVHDPGAAMMGGVGGHAGLFSNANDLAKLMQMFLNGGTYGGERYLSDSVLADFTRCQFCDHDNRRGAGFDKPTPDGSWGPTCNCISMKSFGHTGFTGTLAWADPEKKIVYVFLSNRIYPDAANKKLIEMGVRTRIMQVIYNAVNKKE